MIYRTLISVEELAENYESADWAVVDCRFSLADPSLGRRQYLEAHIPGAVYAHLDEDLSRPIVPGVTGRHPLPDVEVFANTVSNWGIAGGTQVVVYDDAGGAYADRLWWMLRWLGHEAVAVLDGGWPRWEAAGHPVRGGQESRTAREFVAQPRAGEIVTTEEVYAKLGSSSLRLIDARSAPRYRGEEEPIDPVAGHIPGALSAPHMDNLQADGRFKPTGELRQQYEELLAGAPAANAVFYCGSGVTSIHGLLALEHIGMPGARLYVGSWSEWIADPDRPIATGPNP